jgi:hypothetical protein
MKKISIVRFAIASLVALSAFVAAQTFARPAVSDVTLTGLVTCSRCSDLSQHKGFTPWTWAMYKVSQGDDIVLLVSGKTYKLQGDGQQLSKYVEDKVTVSGHLDANTIVVTNIARPAKEK